MEIVAILLGVIVLGIILSKVKDRNDRKDQPDPAVHALPFATVGDPSEDETAAEGHQLPLGVEPVIIST